MITKMIHTWFEAVEVTGFLRSKGAKRLASRNIPKIRMTAAIFPVPMSNVDASGLTQPEIRVMNLLISSGDINSHVIWRFVAVPRKKRFRSIQIPMGNRLMATKIQESLSLPRQLLDEASHINPSPAGKRAKPAYRVRIARAMQPADKIR